MKKWVVFVLFLLLLAACSTAEGEGDQADKEIENNSEQEVVQEEPDQEDKEEDTEEKAEEEAEEVDRVVEPQYKLTETWSFEPIGEANPRVALLTIDDVPDKRALEMAATLKELDAPAIFFVNGHFIQSEEKRQILKEIHEMGFAIGNHTFNHQKLDEVSEEKQREEIVSLSDEIESIIGERPKFFRAPHGVNTDYSKQVALEEGMLLMNWTYGYDYFKEYMEADALADIMVNTNLLGNGANLLMHDREWTAEALPEIVQGLREKEFELLDPALIQLPK
ncbi:polysaccharide deacetylase family protein [Halobacillus fulvus]|nr:polysaccharide deacetylase family protein [Halobacillus fulvus]